MVMFQVMSNLLYFYGMCSLVKECLLQRYFSKVGSYCFTVLCGVLGFHFLLCELFLFCWQEVRGSAQVHESDIVQACRSVSFNSLCFLLYVCRLKYNFLNSWQSSLRLACSYWMRSKVQMSGAFFKLLMGTPSTNYVNSLSTRPVKHS